ncbi:MAG: hypothetical protein V4739_05855 [Pseudomonadota bacterium]
MSRSRSEVRQRRAVWLCEGTAWTVSVAFYALQNQLQIIGGDIAWAKSLWLAHALLFWLVLPAVLLTDARIAPPLHRPFQALLVWMGARVALESAMLYHWHNWLPAYGIAHDAVAGVGLGLWCVHWRRQHGAGALAIDRVVAWHVAFTALLFIPEICFAAYMQLHFHTQGDGAIYFVPDDPRHALILALTQAVNVCVAGYLVYCLRSPLYAPNQRPNS